MTFPATMESGPARNESPGRTTQDSRSQRDTLANLYQGFFTGIVRIQAHRQQLGDPETFRARMKNALKETRRDAITAGYSPENVEDTEFAIVAFLDEVILNSDDPARQAWAKMTLNVEMFGEAVAGEVFFERLESFRKRQDSPRLADLLEVYLLCLLLGFEGRYVGSKGEIYAISHRIRNRLDAIRQTDPRLITPEAMPPLEKRPPPLRFVQAAPRWKLLAFGGIAASLLAFLLLKLNLWWNIRALDTTILR